MLILDGRMINTVLSLPASVMRGFGILTSKPTGVEPGLVFGSRLSSGLENGSLFFPVAEQGRMIEQPPPLLAENDPLCIVGIAASQVADSPNVTFFHHQTVLDGKTSRHQTVIVIRIAVKPGKKVGVGIILQNAVAFVGKAFIVYAAVTSDERMAAFRKLILILDTIGRVC